MVEFQNVTYFIERERIVRPLPWIREGSKEAETLERIKRHQRIRRNLRTDNYSTSSGTSVISSMDNAYRFYTQAEAGRPKGLAISRKQWLSNARISLPCGACDDPRVSCHTCLWHMVVIEASLGNQSFHGVRVGFSISISFRMHAN